MKIVKVLLVLIVTTFIAGSAMAQTQSRHHWRHHYSRHHYHRIHHRY
jgi:hypothetical protein